MCTHTHTPAYSIDTSTVTLSDNTLPAGMHGSHTVMLAEQCEQPDMPTRTLKVVKQSFSWLHYQYVGWVLLCDSPPKTVPFPFPPPPTHIPSHHMTSFIFPSLVAIGNLICTSILHFLKAISTLKLPRKLASVCSETASLDVLLMCTMILYTWCVLFCYLEGLHRCLVQPINGDLIAALSCKQTTRCVVYRVYIYVHKYRRDSC